MTTKETSSVFHVYVNQKFVFGLTKYVMGTGKIINFKINIITTRGFGR